jgi:hypothetical protein
MIMVRKVGVMTQSLMIRKAMITFGYKLKMPFTKLKVTSRIAPKKLFLNLKLVSNLKRRLQTLQAIMK